MASRFSTTASMTMSAPDSFSSDVVPSSRSRISAFRSGVTLPRSTPLARNDSIFPRPFFRRSSLTSRTMTL